MSLLDVHEPHMFCDYLSSPAMSANVAAVSQRFLPRGHILPAFSHYRLSMRASFDAQRVQGWSFVQRYQGLEDSI